MEKSELQSFGLLLFFETYYRMVISYRNELSAEPLYDVFFCSNWYSKTLTPTGTEKSIGLINLIPVV